MKAFLYFIAGSLFLAGSLLPYRAYSHSNPPIRATGGILDLRSVDLHQEPIPLNGEWSFFWNQLLLPGDKGGEEDHIPFPSLWNEVQLHGRQLPARGYASYRLTILLPPNRPGRLALEIPDVYSSYALYVNGSLFARNGKPGKTAAESKPFWTSQTIGINHPGDTLVLLLQVANYWHSKGGTYKEILIGDRDQLFLKRERETASDLILTGCLFMGGLFFLGLYLFGRKENTILYFSLFCIVYSYRMIGTDLYVLHSLFPSYSWFLAIRLEYFTLTFGLALFVQYTRCLYSEDSHPAIMKGMLLFCLGFCALVLLTPPQIFTGLINLFLGAMFICIAYASYINIHAARNKRNGSVYALLSTTVVMVVFFLINLNYFGWMVSPRGIVFTGYILFFFLQSLALSHRFAMNFRQAASEAQQGLRAKTEFLSTMSHEIRTPLNAVIGMTHLLLKHHPRQDQKKDLDVLLFSANNLLSIVNNILDYNKIEEGKISFEHIPMNLAAMAEKIIAGFRMKAEEKGIDLQLSIDEKLGHDVLGDPTRTSQVINNLVHNAIKFTHRGWVRLSLAVKHCGQGQMQITVSVEDTGIGIPQDKQQVIFERFTQADSSTSRSYGGTGLGLAISQKILQWQGVELKLTSESGKGSVFYFTQSFLVAPEKNELSESRISEDKTDLLKGVSILLVEDNPLNVLVAQTILENGGAQIDVATNGREALTTYDSKKHRLILMDLHMPEMDGYEATEVLREQGETLPIIALTANTAQEVEGDLYDSGLTDIVVKPFNPENLYRVILQYVQ